jgi:hypothetical protein
MTCRPGAIGDGETATLGALSFYGFRMDALTDKPATEIAVSTLHRFGDSQDDIDAVLAKLMNTSYLSLRQVLLVLTLLVHVLRKFSQPTHGAAATEVAVQTVLKKTDVYQRAIKLMLHQSDAAKFMLRDGEGDCALVRRLNLLKSVRARKFFQSLA